ncbi:F-box/WD repeat-containing protein [Legionella brunensis]|uniref:Uncharacterized protein n=1 Tax=Legionella brunensis TaxID=29422 RepID=A0A0W0SUD6_9GAMM|nr:F-box/WD repeat-containing protein [Legionella brunensis]KTC86998.1 hypothetical protein Lbru_0227 [Legionella brunensis]
MQVSVKKSNILLPNEIWVFIFSLNILDKLDLIYLTMVCSLFNKLIKENTHLIKNAPFPLPDYSQYFTQEFFKSEVQMTFLLKLKNNNLVCGLNNGKIYVLDAVSGEYKQTLTAHLERINTRTTILAQLSLLGLNTKAYGEITNPIRAIIEHSSGDIISGAEDRTIRVFDANSEQCKLTFTGHYGAISAIHELDQKSVISASIRGDIHIWDKTSGKSEKQFDWNQTGVSSLAVLKSGLIVSGGRNGSLCFFDKDSNTHTLAHGHTKAIRVITAFDDKRLITGADDATIRIWDIASRTCIKVLKRHKNSINAIIELGENLIISSSNDKTMRLWNINTGKCIRKLDGYQSPITSLIKRDNGNISFVLGNVIKILHFGYIDCRQDEKEAIIPANRIRF